MSIIKRIYWEKPSEKGIRIYVHLNAETDFRHAPSVTAFLPLKGTYFGSWIAARKTLIKSTCFITLFPIFLGLVYVTRLKLYPKISL